MFEDEAGELTLAPSRSDAGPARRPTTVVPPSPRVAQLRSALGAVAAVDPVELPEAQALADARELLALRAQLDAVLLRRIGDVDVRGLHRLDASPTTSAWIRRQDATVDPSTITLARRLTRLPGLQDAVRTGLLNPGAAAKVAAALDGLRRCVDRPDGLIDGQPGEAAVCAVVVDGVRSTVCQALGGLDDDDPRVVELAAQLSEVSCWPTSQLARLEAAFVLLAQHLPGTHLRAGLALLVDALLPSELEQRAARAADDAQAEPAPEQRRLGLAAARRARPGDRRAAAHRLGAMTAVDPDNPVDTDAAEKLRASGWEFGDPFPLGLSPSDSPSRAARTAAARRPALGAANAARTAASLGLRDKIAPHISVTVGLRALHCEPGATPATGAAGVTVPLSLIRKWWCDAHVTRFVLGLGHRVLETSHTARTLKAHERRIKHLETGGHCQGAGCCRGPGHRLIPHHVDAWASSGTTALSGTVLLCESDHGALHRGRTLTLKDGRRLNENGWVS
jgi:hypothetical protein